eukprot:862927-Pyramimonas_sp.AAC.1
MQSGSPILLAPTPDIVLRRAKASPPRRVKYMFPGPLNILLSVVQCACDRAASFRFTTDNFKAASLLLNFWRSLVFVCVSFAFLFSTVFSRTDC